MAKKLLTVLLSLTICLSCATCGADATTSTANEANADSVEASVESGDAESEKESVESEEATEGSSEESKEESKEQANEQSVEESETKSKEETDAESKEETDAESKEETESKAEESKNDTANEGEGAWLEGTGYKLLLSSKWLTVDEYKDQLKSEMAAKGQSVIAVPIMIGVENARYYNDGDLTNGAPSIVISKPQQNSTFKSITIKDIESQIKSTVENSFSSDESAKIEEKGIVKLSGADALEYDIEATIDGVAQKAVCYFVLNGEYFFSIRTAVPVDQAADFEKELKTVIDSLTYTE